MAYSLEHYTRYKAAHLLMPIAYEPDQRFFYNADQTLGVGYLCRPLVSGDQKTAERLNVLFKDNWPDDTVIQFIMLASPNIQPIINDMRACRTGQADPLMREVVEARADFLTRGAEVPVERRTSLRVRDFQLIVTVKIPLADERPNLDEVKRLSEINTSTEKALESIGLYPRTLTSQAYIDLMSAILNHSPSASWRSTGGVRLEADKELREQVFDYDTDIKVHRRHITLGSAHVRTLSVKRFPHAVYFGAAASFIGDLFEGTRGIRSPFLMCATLHMPDSNKLRSKINGKKQITNYQAYGPMLKWMPKLAQKKRDFDEVATAMDNGDRPLRVTLTLNLFAESEEAATAAVSATTSYWGELGYSLMPDEFICMGLFLNSLPFNADVKAMEDLKRYKTMASSQASTLIPLFADWRGTGTPILNLISRNGQLMSLDLYNSGTNYNTTIAAASGSGKSFLSNEIISSYLSINGQVWVVDVGRSYLKLCELFEGDFLYFGKDSDICLNPFGIVNDYDEEADMLVGLLTAMAAPREGLDEIQEQYLKMALRKLWTAKGKDMNVDDIITELQDHEDERARDIATQLYSFSSLGEYGRFFAGKNNVNFKNRFTVLELEELKGRKHLQQVVLLQLLLQISSEMYLGERNRRKLVLIDEAWELLTHGDVAKFIEAGYRKFRKYGGSAITITQGVSDLYASPTGRAIVENSANMLLLGQKAEAIEALKKEGRLPLTDGGYELLKTVHTMPGVYSEIFWISDFGVGVGKLIVDKFRQLIYSTKPEDVQAIKNYKDQGLNVAEACKRVLEDRRRLELGRIAA